jgi:hypothetical protein
VTGRRRGLAAFAAFHALAAWGGAVALVTGAIDLGPDLDARLPLHSPVLGGLALAAFAAVPLSSLAAGAWRGAPDADDRAAVAGALLVAWILLELSVLRALSWLQPVYLAVGIALFLVGVRPRSASPAPPDQGHWSHEEGPSGRCAVGGALRTVRPVPRQPRRSTP